MQKYVLMSAAEAQQYRSKEWFNNETFSLNVKSKGLAFFIPDDLITIDKILNIDNNYYSRVIKFFLATNYFYSILDEIKETEYYRHGIKASVNKLLDELDRLQKHPDIKKFYELANPEIHLNNLDLHSMFFEKLPLISSEFLEEFMIEFLTKYNIQDEK